MLNSADAGWRLSFRIAMLQVVVVALVAAIYFLSSQRAAWAVVAGGGFMVVGGLLAAWGTFAGGVTGAGIALGRLVLGMVAKWFVVIAGMYVAMAVWKLPAVPVLVGAALAAAAFVVSLRFVTKRSTTRTIA